MRVVVAFGAHQMQLREGLQMKLTRQASFVTGWWEEIGEVGGGPQGHISGCGWINWVHGKWMLEGSKPKEIGDAFHLGLVNLRRLRNISGDK